MAAISNMAARSLLFVKLMNSYKTLTVIVTSLLVSIVTGCGQTGPLYLPGQKPPIYVPPEPIPEPEDEPEYKPEPEA